MSTQVRRLSLVLSLAGLPLAQAAMPYSVEFCSPMTLNYRQNELTTCYSGGPRRHECKGDSYHRCDGPWNDLRRFELGAVRDGETLPSLVRISPERPAPTSTAEASQLASHIARAQETAEWIALRRAQTEAELHDQCGDTQSAGFSECQALFMREQQMNQHYQQQQ